MLDLLLSLIPGAQLTVILGAVLAVLGFIWRVFVAGKRSERAKADRADLDAMKARKEKQDEIDALGPADLDSRFTRWLRDKQR